MEKADQSPGHVVISLGQYQAAFAHPSLAFQQVHGASPSVPDEQ
jgi:hypothetical protein